MQKQLVKQKPQFNYEDALFQDVIIQERHDAIVDLCKQQEECLELMKNLATLTDEQGEMIDDLRSNITLSNKHVKDGVESLEKADKYQETNNNLTFYVLIGTIVSVLTAGTITIAVT